MIRIGFLGCGKIGRTLVKRILSLPDTEISFIQDPSFQNDLALSCPITEQVSKELIVSTDFIIECATADVLKQNIDNILPYCDVMPFSLTAFSDSSFAETVKSLCMLYQHQIFIPHGAILGIDGIFDGKNLWNRVEIITTKNPKSLGRTDTKKEIIYDGSTREVCSLYPRNVNVHACVALAGIGFDKTHSVIISDPSVSTNSHIIKLSGEGMDIELHVSSYANGAVTGAYTPHSACGSLDRALKIHSNKIFV